jgi:37-kD nucleoid-associated bacterial protein
MLDFSQSRLERLIIHHIGSRIEEEGVTLSEQEIVVNEDIILSTLSHYFLNPFKNPTFYSFHLSEEANLPVRDAAESVFADSSEFVDLSARLAYALYQNSEHPKIKKGDLYVAFFRDCVVEDELVDALGIFKAESHETFLKVYPEGANFRLGVENGISINKLDKGSLIFNTEADLGYKICSIDHSGKSEAIFWRDNFLKIKQREDDFYHTKNAMNLYKDFIQEVVEAEVQVPRTEQIAMKKKAVQYFEEKERFDSKEFENEVIGEPQIIEAFRNYKEQYSQEHQIPQVEDFEISETAVKSGKKALKTVLKLDKNFHVYIHGNQELLTKGFDPAKQMNYYQLYFREEK